MLTIMPLYFLALLVCLSFPYSLLPLSHSPTSYHLLLLIDSLYPLHFLCFSSILLHSPSRIKQSVEIDHLKIHTNFGDTFGANLHSSVLKRIYINGRINLSRTFHSPVRCISFVVCVPFLSLCVQFYLASCVQ